MSYPQWLSGLWLLSLPLVAQVIEFESGGLRYQTLTKNGLTIMVAELPSHVRDYSVLQVAVSNGGASAQVVKPDDFVIFRADGAQMTSIAPRRVVSNLIDKGSRNDVIKLVTAYENGIYGNNKYKGTNGYEARRQNMLAEVNSTKLKAAAAASAIAFVNTRLAPGQTTDGAVFYPTEGKPLGLGTVRIRAAGALFEFPLLSSN
ncbi:MAG: hypothetical protein WKF37_05045 [Bryobacteraceae bacterium]